MSKTTVTIQGMSCGHCVMGVKKALAGVPGIKVLDVQIGKAEFEYENPSAIDAAKGAIEEEGYDVVAVG